MIIYVSYNSRDQELAQALAIELGLIGHDVQFEQKQLGGQARWQDVFASIEACDLFLLVVSRDTLESYSAHLEYSYAYALNKRILPVLVEDINPSALPLQLTAIEPIFWRPGEHSSRILITALEELPPPAVPSRLPPLRPDLVVPFAHLRNEMSNLPAEFQTQKRIFNNLREFLEREDTFFNASSVLRLLQMHPNTIPEIAREVELMLNGLSEDLEKKRRASRRLRWLRDVALLVAGALLVLVVIRGITFLRPYLGLSSSSTLAATSEVTPESTEAATPVDTAETTPAVEQTEETAPIPSDTPPPPTPDLQGTQNALDAASTAVVETVSAPSATPPPPTEAAPAPIIPTPALTTDQPTPTDIVPAAPPTIAPVQYIGVQVEDTDQGVQVTGLGANAEQAGIRLGDYATTIDGETVQSSQQFIDNLSARPLLSQVTFGLRRGISTIFIRVTLSHLDFSVPTAEPTVSSQ